MGIKAMPCVAITCDMCGKGHDELWTTSKEEVENLKINAKGVKNMRMNLICGSRQSGVTSSLILRAVKYNYPMVVDTEAHKKEVEKICKKNNWECPVVYTFREIKEKRGLKLNNLIIDNLDEFLDWCMREIGVCARVDTVGLNVDTKSEKEMFIYDLIDEKNIIKDTCEENINIKDTCEESTPIFDVCEYTTPIKDVCEDLAQ